MEMIFTTNEKFWSRVFRFFVKEPSSHICLKFNISGFLFSIDCSTEGGRLMPWDKFLGSHNIISTVVFPTSDVLEKLLFEKALFVVGKKYDMGAYKYGLWRAVLKTLFKIPYPEINICSDPEKFACTEIIYPIQDILESQFEISFKDVDLAAMSPWMIFSKIADEASYAVQKD
jgi:hypothetical protein